MDKIADIARALVATREPRIAERLLRELLTESEAEKLSLRWDIVRLLAQGQSQRAIAHQLGVSLCNITRGARELKKRRSTLKQIFEAPSVSS